MSDLWVICAEQIFSATGSASAYGAERAWALTKPRQFGPSTVTSFATARATIASSSARPSSPTSR